MQFCFVFFSDCEQVKSIYCRTRLCKESVSSGCLQSLQKNKPTQGQVTEAEVGR